MQKPTEVIAPPILGEIGLSSEGRAYRAYPDLRSARWLLPDGPPSVVRAGIDGLFRPSSLKGKTLKRLISLGVFRGRRAFLEEEFLKELEEDLIRVLGVSELHVAFYIGVPGAYQKITAQVLGANGESLAFVKIATSPQTLKDVETEHRVLSRLSESESMYGRVPEALGYFDWRGGRVLAMTSGPSGRAPRDLSYVHHEFCRDIFTAFAEEKVFGESPMMRRMTETSQRLAPDLSEEYASRFGRALALLGEGLGSVTLPLSLAHRDFAPWNTRAGGERGLFVFDWDRAEEGSTPLYDVFHFQAIQSVLLGRPDHLPDSVFLHNLLDDIWPEGGEHLSWLYLTYLTDMCLFYTEARVVAPEAGEEGVWRWFMDRLDDFIQRGFPLR